MTDSEILDVVKNSMSEKRFSHTLGCAEMAKRLSERWGCDSSLAYRAAILHDITKEMPYEEQLKLIDNSGIILSGLQRSEKIIHAFSAAELAKSRFNQCEQVCDAIRWHTTARKNMSLLEKIVWISDLTEEGRSFDGVEKIRSLAFSDLSAALVEGFDTTICMLIRRRNAIDINMIEARNFELALIGERKIN